MVAWCRLVLLNRMLEEGNTVYRAGDLDTAAATYTAALDRMGGAGRGGAAWASLRTRLLLNLSRAQRRRGRTREAVAAASEVLAAEPECAEALVTRAKAARAGGLVAEAVEDYAAALRLQPTNQTVYLEFLKLREELKMKSRKQAFFSRSCDSIAYIDDSETNCSSI